MTKYKVFNLDVWCHGEDEEGDLEWDINNWDLIKTINVEFTKFNSDDQVIINALYDNEIITTQDIELFTIEWYDGQVEIYAADDGMPLFTLQEET